MHSLQPGRCLFCSAGDEPHTRCTAWRPRACTVHRLHLPSFLPHTTAFSCMLLRPLHVFLLWILFAVHGLPLGRSPPFSSAAGLRLHLRFLISCRAAAPPARHIARALFRHHHNHLSFYKIVVGSFYHAMRRYVSYHICVTALASICRSCCVRCSWVRAHNTLYIAPAHYRAGPRTLSPFRRHILVLAHARHSMDADIAHKKATACIWIRLLRGSCITRAYGFISTLGKWTGL